MDTVTLGDYLLAQGDGEGSESERMAALQKMIDAGMWGGQGSTGRAMMAAIEAGECMLGPNPARDAYGNRIPSRFEVQAGTMGSPEYVAAAAERRDR